MDFHGSYLARNVSYHQCQVAMIPRNVIGTYPINVR